MKISREIVRGIVSGRNKARLFGAVAMAAALAAGCGSESPTAGSGARGGSSGNTGGGGSGLGGHAGGGGGSPAGGGSGGGAAAPIVLTGTAVAISAGDFYACVVLSSGQVACWGWNREGEIALPVTIMNNSVLSPVGEPGLTSATAIAAGSGHTCALLSGGTVECWGVDDFGELGHGLTGYEVVAYPPAAVTGLSGATAIAAGSFHSCALLSGGTVECWGDNEKGELGDGTKQASSAPVELTGLTGATAIAAGQVHSCALLSGGTVECWGYNEQGQLGNGTTMSSSKPVPVAGLTGATAIDARWDHTCALLQGGGVECWGSNTAGDLGNGTLTDSAIPVAVTGLAGATAIAAGTDHTCALLSGGTVECWGDGSRGELGSGGITNWSTAPVAVAGLTGATAVAAGNGFSCAILSGGSVECWGQNGEGELGNGATTPATTPVPVSGL